MYLITGDLTKLWTATFGVRMPHTWGHSPMSRPLVSDNQSRLEQNLFVRFSVAPTQMNLLPASSSVIAAKAAKNTGARIIECMNSNRQGHMT